MQNKLLICIKTDLELESNSPFIDRYLTSSLGVLIVVKDVPIDVCIKDRQAWCSSLVA